MAGEDNSQHDGGKDGSVVEKCTANKPIPALDPAGMGLFLLKNIQVFLNEYIENG